MFFFLSALLACQAAPPQEAPKRMTLPEGFKAVLFAGEPDVVQPIGITFDDRGRLWVAECRTYPKWLKPEEEGKDRILIFEDTDGDGRFDTRKVFYDKVLNLSGIEIGFGGVWACSTPNLVFIPDRNGDDAPDGPPEVLLDGWNLQKAQHNVFNHLAWGPDGWLYGCNGIQSDSRVGKPGTPADQRIAINCGVWRFHPVTRTFEVVATGTTNPWGLDWDDFGQAFITNCVIKHLFHVIPGARYERMHGQEFNPHTYALMPSCADHIHWAGGKWTEARGQPKHSEAGGGHAHVGAMVYLGDTWPDRYRNTIFTLNVHGNRMNHDTLERQGSGYVARHARDFLLANDPWFRGIAVKQAPDGSAFVTDWTDTGECHNYKVVDATNGRIYKISYGEAKAARFDLAALSDAELVKLQTHKNDWWVRRARRLLQERAAVGAAPALLKQLREETEAPRRLRALWALHAIGRTDETLILELLDSPHDYVRAWAIQLGLENKSPSSTLHARLVEMAVKDASPVARVNLASGLQRMPLEQRWPIAEALAAREEDAADANIPLMIWYGIEPAVATDKNRAVALLGKSKIPLLRQHITRRLAAVAK